MRPRRDFVTSDLHLQHQLLADLRGFKDIASMHAALVRKWNSTVAKTDKVWIVGDVGLGQKAPIRMLLDKMNGEKHLVLGNHDLRNGIKPVNFGHVLTVHDLYVVVTARGENWLLIHDVNTMHEVINPSLLCGIKGIICGHNHSGPVYDVYNGIPTCNVAVDLHKLRPILLDDVCKRLHQ